MLSSRYIMKFGASQKFRIFFLGFSSNSATTFNKTAYHKRNMSSYSLKPSETRPWRESASVMIVAPMNISQPYSLGLLMTQRSKGSTVGPGHTVFPGGVISDADFSPKWIEYFKKFNVDITKSGFPDAGRGNVPSIYDGVAAEELNAVSKHVALRLTAIREIFEEVGILMCRNPSEKITPIMTPFDCDILKDKKTVQSWQKRIIKNPIEFITLCETLNCLPDIYSLSDWSNWLTPTVVKPKVRFDTIFYLAIFDSMPRVRWDPVEVASAQWASAKNLLDEYENGSIKLMPPQLYELSQLASLKTTNAIMKVVTRRRKEGIKRFCPVVRVAEDGQVLLLPGDKQYPQKNDIYSQTKPPVSINLSCMEMRQGGGPYNRMELGNKTFKFNCIVTTDIEYM